MTRFDLVWMFLVAAFIIAAAGVDADDDRPPAYVVDSDYTAVRNDVLSRLNAADDKLPACEAALNAAQSDVVALKADGDAARAAVDQLRASVDDHRRHIEYLQSVVESLRASSTPSLWEDVDGALGVAGGYALGTGMCVGLAWVFNQPAFTR